MGKAKSVHCGKEVFDLAADCPFCGKPIANREAPTNVSASPWGWKNRDVGKSNARLIIAVVAVVLAAAAAAAYFFLRVSGS